MSKLNWDKRAAKDRASHLREPEREHLAHPVRLRQTLQLQQLVQRIDRHEWLNFKTEAKQQKKKVSLYRQLERAYEEYIIKYPSHKNSKFAKRVADVLNDLDTPSQ